jgi:hypothetical protein
MSAEDFRHCVDFPDQPVIERRLIEFAGWLVVKRTIDIKNLSLLLNGHPVDDIRFFNRDAIPHVTDETVYGWSFWVDLEPFKQADSPVMVMDWHIGTHRLGSAYFRYLPRARSRPGAQTFFIHMPKTAGTAVREQISKYQNHFHLLSVYDGKNVRGMGTKNFLTLSPDAIDTVDVVYGHFQYGLHVNYPRNYNYITILRDPYQYLISDFFFRQRVIKSPAFNAFATIFDLVNEDKFDLSNNKRLNFFDNTFCRYLSGTVSVDAPVTDYDLKAAKDSIARDFAFVGINERLMDSLLEISRRLGLDLLRNLSKLNATPSVNERRTLDMEKFRKAAYPWVRYDLELYDHVVKTFWGA